MYIYIYIYIYILISFKLNYIPYKIHKYFNFKICFEQFFFGKSFEEILTT